MPPVECNHMRPITAVSFSFVVLNSRGIESPAGTDGGGRGRKTNSTCVLFVARSGIRMQANARPARPPASTARAGRRNGGPEGTRLSRMQLDSRAIPPASTNKAKKLIRKGGLFVCPTNGSFPASLLNPSPDNGIVRASPIKVRIWLPMQSQNTN